MENFTADGKEKGCVRADSNMRLEKHGFCGEMFTKMAANNSSHPYTHTFYSYQVVKSMIPLFELGLTL